MMKKSKQYFSKFVWVIILVGAGFLLGLLLTNGTQSTVIHLDESIIEERIMMDVEERVQMQVREVEEIERQFEQMAEEFSNIPPIPEIPPLPELPEIPEGATVHVTVTDSPFSGFGSTASMLTAVSLILFGAWMFMNGRQAKEKSPPSEIYD